MSIVASHYFHRRAFVRNGGDLSTLPYKAPLFPLVPILAFVACLGSMIGIGFDPTQAPALYFGGAYTVACYLFFHFRYKKRGAAAVAASEPLGAEEDDAKVPAGVGA